MELTRVHKTHYNFPVEISKVTLVCLLRSDRTGGVRRAPYGRNHSAVIVERLVSCGGDAWESAASEYCVELCRGPRGAPPTVKEGE